MPDAAPQSSRVANMQLEKWTGSTAAPVAVTLGASNPTEQVDDSHAYSCAYSLRAVRKVIALLTVDDGDGEGQKWHG